MMNFTFNFFYPFMTAFTTLWTASLFNSGNHFSSAYNNNICTSTATTATVAHPIGRPRRTRTSVSRSAPEIKQSSNGRSVLRRSGRLRHKYVIPEKNILSSAPRRRRKLRREGAIADLQQLESEIPTPTDTSRRQLKREDSFILVDYGDCFRMVKPAFAMRYFHSVPDNIRTVAPYHALGANVGEQELRARLLAIPIATPPIGTKRVRFMMEEGEEPEDVDDNPRPRKRRRSS